MASGAPEGSLVRFRDQDYTKAGVMRQIQQIGPLAERYEAQMEVGRLLMEHHLKGERGIEIWYNYVEQDQARTTVGSRRFRQDWKEAKVVAKRSRSQREKVETTRRTILEAWGNRAREMASQPAYYTLSKLRILTGEYAFEQALSPINRAVLVRIYQYTKNKRDWSAEPQAVDYDRVRDRGEDLPEIKQHDLERFDLYLDDAGVLRQIEQ